MSDFAQPLVAAPPSGALTCSGPASMGADYYHLSSTALINVTATWTNANQAVYQAVMVQNTVTVTHMAVFVTTAAGNIDVGIYTEGGTRLVSSGSTAVSGSSALQSFNITDTTLGPGVYWLACTCSSTSAVLRNGPFTAATVVHARVRGVMVESSALPLPATATFGVQGNSALNVPWVTALYRTTF